MCKILSSPEASPVKKEVECVCVVCVCVLEKGRVNRPGEIKTKGHSGPKYGWKDAGDRNNKGDFGRGH